MNLLILLFALIAIIGIIIQESRIRSVTSSREHYRLSYINLNNATADHNREMIARLRGVCDSLTPSPVEAMSDDVAQQLVDNFYNSSYRN